MPQTLPSPLSPDKPKLLERVRDVVRRKHFSIRTEQAYPEWIRRFILFHHKRHPAEMAEPEVTAFLTHMTRDEQVASSTQNQALSAILFLYKEVLKQEIGWLNRGPSMGRRSQRSEVRGSKASKTNAVPKCNLGTRRRGEKSEVGARRSRSKWKGDPVELLVGAGGG